MFNYHTFDTFKTGTLLKTPSLHSLRIFFPHSAPPPSFCFWQSQFHSTSMNLTIQGISNKWDHTLSVPLILASVDLTSSPLQSKLLIFTSVNTMSQTPKVYSQLSPYAYASWHFYLLNLPFIPFCSGNHIYFLCGSFILLSLVCFLCFFIFFLHTWEIKWCLSFSEQADIERRKIYKLKSITQSTIISEQTGKNSSTEQKK